MSHTLSASRLGLAAWATFMLATCTYCLVYQAFVSAVTPDPGRTLAVALREWGAWALLAPWALAIFRRRPGWRDTALRCASLALLAALLPIVADQITGDRGVVSSLALFWPRNIAMAIALLLIARVFAPPVTAPATRAAAPARLTTAPMNGGPATLLVSKGADQCLIRVDDIQYLSASGNYVDICAANQRYLKRSTIGDLEAALPPEHFVRIHRSHIVRVREIERIRVERSGSGTVRLRGGAELAISRRYRAQLKSRQDAARSSIH